MALRSRYCFIKIITVLCTHTFQLCVIPCHKCAHDISHCFFFTRLPLTSTLTHLPLSGDFKTNAFNLLRYLQILLREDSDRTAFRRANGMTILSEFMSTNLADLRKPHIRKLCVQVRVHGHVFWLSVFSSRSVHALLVTHAHSAFLHIL